jgi:hypothetical protein
MSICIFVHICVHSFPRCYIRFDAYPNYTHIKTFLKQCVKRKATTQIGANVRARVFNAGMLAGSQFTSGRSCDRPTRSRVSVVFFGPRENAELVPKFHVELHASHAAVPMVTLKILPYINVTLTFDWTTLFMGDMDEGTWPSRLGESQMRQ